ncbi:MAG: SgcJ/EcaC family oxidoreductase [Deltaproteobacteria bacterium]|nr:SgcJ/EcaC family oxidoreductase [Deltaproteobacteria bacterium]
MVARVALGLIISSILMVSWVSAEKTGLNQDEIAIRKAIETYVEAYNRGDASAAATHWSRQGSYLTITGEYAKGPDKIRAALDQFFAENKGIQVKVAIFDVQLQSAGRAIAKGFAVFQRPGEESDEVLFTATHVKEGGSWKLLKVEEEESAVPLGTIARLGELEWLIGDWVDQDESGSVETTFRWAKDYSFINGAFRVIVGDRVDLEGTQVIGWDPVAKRIRSWIFDTRAGFGEGEWSRAGNTWTVKLRSVLGTGQKASSLNIYTYVDPNSFTWQSVGREVGGELLSDIDEVRVVRKNAEKAQAKPRK